jgi:hypothetical protein
MPRKSKRDLAQLGRRYGDFILAVFERLCSDDGTTIGTEDLKAFQFWNANKVLALENKLRAEGLAESDLPVWRSGYRDQFASNAAEIASGIGGKADMAKSGGHVAV